MSDVKSLFNKKKKTVSKAKPVQTAVKSAVEAPNEDDDWGLPAQEQEVMFVTKAVGQLSTARKEPEDLAVRVVAEDTRQIFHQVRAKAVMGPTSPPSSAPQPEETKEAPKPLAGSRPGVWRSSRVQAAEGGPAVPFKTKVEEFPALAPTPAAPAAKTAATKASAWARINALNAEQQQPQEQAQHQQEEQVQQSPVANAKEALPLEPATEVGTTVQEPEQRKVETTEERVQEEKPALVAESAPVSPPPAPAATPAPPVPPAEEPKAEAAPEAPQEEEAQPANLKSKFGSKKKKKALDF